MTIEIVRNFFAWSSVINICLIIVWFVAFVAAHNWMYRLHTKWFKVSEHTFDAIHYGGLGLFKIAIWVFNLTPYFALRIIG